MSNQRIFTKEEIVQEICRVTGGVGKLNKVGKSFELGAAVKRDRV